MKAKSMVAAFMRRSSSGTMTASYWWDSAGQEELQQESQAFCSEPQLSGSGFWAAMVDGVSRRSSRQNPGVKLRRLLTPVPGCMPAASC